MIKTDAELDEKLDQLARLYRGVRHEFSKITITEQSAAKLVLGTRRLVAALTVLLSDVEEYTGAGEIRRLGEAMRDIEAKREGTDRREKA